MHDPQSVAFEIKNPFAKKGRYKSPLITIWHCDPEKDGTDDSCGWFIRARHIDPAIVEKVRKRFAFNFQHNYWFNDGGYPKFSTMGLTLEMYSSAAWEIFMFQNGGKPDRKRYERFMRKHLFDILHFAENPTDSIGDSITGKYGIDSNEHRINHFTSVVVGDIYRKLRKWWQHPKWHIHHWRIQFHPFQDLKRRYWDKCAICGQRGFKSAPFSDWSGSKIWHQECDKSTAKP